MGLGMGPFEGDFAFMFFPNFLCVFGKCFFSFLLYLFQKKVSLLALVSEFYCKCFLRSRCSMEMWCLDDAGRDSWDWVGPPAWGRACFNSPEWGGSSSPVKTEPPQIVLLLLLFLTMVDETQVYIHCMSREPSGTVPVASHLGVKLPTTPAPQGALDNEELFIVEGSQNPSTPGLNPSRGSPKNGAKCAEKALRTQLAECVPVSVANWDVHQIRR